MDYYVFCVIATIFFWVLCALAVVSGMIWVYCYVQYYKWEKEAREKNSIINEIQKAVKEAWEEYEEPYDSGGNLQD